MAKEESDSTDRNQRGKKISKVVFPVADTKLNLPEGYVSFINEIKEQIVKTRLQTVITANTSMIILYWQIGNAILQRQQNEGWGTKVIDHMSYDLKHAFPEMSEFSPRNLKYMRKFAEAWTDFAIVQRTVALIGYYGQSLPPLRCKVYHLNEVVVVV